MVAISTFLLALLPLASASPLLSSSLHNFAAPGAPDTSCILFHCLGKATSCQSTAPCSTTLSCSQACASGNLTCSEQCVTRYGNAQFDDLTVCIQQNKCIAPYPHLNFAVPTTYATTFDIASFVGEWKVAYGLDAGLDCYNNQTINIASVSASSTTYNHVITIIFPEGPKTIPSTMTQTSPGLFSLTYTLGGGGLDTWYILSEGANGDYIVALYLGANKLSNYRGAYVLTKPTTVLSSSDLSDITNVMTSSGTGVTFSQFCQLQ